MGSWRQRVAAAVLPAVGVGGTSLSPQVPDWACHPDLPPDMDNPRDSASYLAVVVD